MAYIRRRSLKAILYIQALLFTGSEVAGQRAAAIISLLATAKANGHCPHACMADRRAHPPADHVGQTHRRAAAVSLGSQQRSWSTRRVKVRWTDAYEATVSGTDKPTES